MLSIGPRTPTKSSKHGSFSHPDLLLTRLQHAQTTKVATVQKEPVILPRTEKSGQAQKMAQPTTKKEPKSPGENAGPTDTKKSADKKKATEAKSTTETNVTETKKAQDAKNSTDKVTERKQGEPKKSTDTTKPQETTKSADAKKPVETKKGDTKKVAPTTKVADVASTPGGAKKPAETTKQVEAKRPEEATLAVEMDDMAAETSRVQKPADTVESAEKTQMDEPLRIYCDGSLMKDVLGVAAVLCHPEQEYILRRRFKAESAGNPLSHNDAEVIALVVGLICLTRYTSKAPTSPSRAVIGCDSLHAIRLTDITVKPEGELTTLLHNRIRDFRQRYPNVEFIFEHTPGHSGIPGNVRAHAEARQAARDPLSATDERLPDTLRRLLPSAAPEKPQDPQPKRLPSLLSPGGVLTTLALLVLLFASNPYATV